jgi:hypothetical protein
VKRREFITLLGAGAVAWPMAARAQQGERMRRIGMLLPFVESDADSQVRIKVFEQTLQQLGWTAGRNVRVDVGWGHDRSRGNDWPRSLSRCGLTSFFLKARPAPRRC